MSGESLRKPSKKPEAWEVLADKYKWDRELVSKVWKEAVKQGLNPMLVTALVGHESGFKPDIIHKNKDGSRDYGLFQLNSRYHPQFQGDVDGHVAYGVNFLREKINQYGVETGLGVYNAGASKTDKAAANRKAYVNRVLPLMKTLYKDIYGTFEEVKT